MLIIGIAGGSGSGKTTVVKAITDQLKDKVVVIPQDSYYKDLSHASEEEKRVHNFDHPDSIDFELLRHQLKELREGKTVQQPIYSYITCGRSKTETLKVDPAEVIIVEGILIFVDKELRDLMDVKVFVDADADVRILRRILRDVKERGRSLESVVNQYLTTVKPMHELFVEPSKKYADVIIPTGGQNIVALDMLVNRIETHLRA
jgi:uridine kinase